MFHTTFRPHQLHPSVWLAPSAIVVGDVTLHEECGVWFHASLRGDSEAIVIGPRTNIQEGAIFHADPGYPAIVGADVTIGHGAIVHGARIGDQVVIGMRAVLLNGCVIGAQSLVGAGALVTEGKEFPSGVLIVGNPARVVRELTREEIERNQRAAAIYVQRAHAFRSGLSLPPTFSGHSGSNLADGPFSTGQLSKEH
jgi:carbonic anhydrase/acetyltransferase-like protein (isoleucine patch superfamily)